MKDRRIFHAWIAASLTLLATVSSLPAGAQNPPPATGVIESPVAHNMWRRYFNNSKNCPAWSDGPQAYQSAASTYPEFLCTGIILRATSPSKEPNGAWVPEKKSWPEDPGANPASKGGFSFSYIRTDAKFFRLAFSFTNGFTVYPLQGKYAAPADKVAYTVLCAFSLDAATDDRSNAGCGAYQQNAQSAPCRSQNITTVTGWYKTYNAASQPTGAYQYQCGFDMTDGVRQPSDFSTVLQGMEPTYIGAEAGTDVNELRLKPWGTYTLDPNAPGAPGNEVVVDKTTAAKLPIESFFYITGTSGLDGAQYDQKLYHDTTGVWVPIVEITLPQSMGVDFQFAYHSTSQKVQPTPADVGALQPCTKGDFDKKC